MVAVAKRSGQCVDQTRHLGIGAAIGFLLIKLLISKKEENDAN
jgi:hypothetical protein